MEATIMENHKRKTKLGLLWCIDRDYIGVVLG